MIPSPQKLELIERCLLAVLVGACVMCGFVYTAAWHLEESGRVFEERLIQQVEQYTRDKLAALHAFAHDEFENMKFADSPNADKVIEVQEAYLKKSSHPEFDILVFLSEHKTPFGNEWELDYLDLIDFDYANNDQGIAYRRIQNLHNSSQWQLRFAVINRTCSFMVGKFSIEMIPLVYGPDGPESFLVGLCSTASYGDLPKYDLKINGHPVNDHSETATIPRARDDNYLVRLIPRDDRIRPKTWLVRP